jgi:CubicO group peptidase (beta-lactamase class C family)
MPGPLDMTKGNPMNKWGAAFLAVVSTTSLAAEPDDRIAAMERTISPLVIVKGDTPSPPTVSLEQRMSQLNVPAVSIAVVVDGKIEWARAYGYADKESRTRATPGTLFQAGSISKPVAALATLQFVEKGSLSLDENVNAKLKSWQVPDNEFTLIHKVTLRNILNHTAGTTVWGFPGYKRVGSVPSVVEVLDGKGNTPPIRVFKKPGQSWLYSGGGYTIMQLLLSDAAGEPFPELMERMVLKPLGMTSSTYAQPLPQNWQSRAASGYQRSGDKVAGGWHVYPEMAAAGLWTTASDLALYLLEVQRSIKGSGRILSASTAREMLRPGLNNHGLGPVLTPDGKRFGHGGADAGFQADVTAFLDGRAGVVILTNSDNGSRLAQELEATLGHIYGWEGLAPPEKTVVTVVPAVLRGYAGTYTREGGPSISVHADGNSIVVSSPPQQDLVLLPESDRKFFDRDAGIPVEFVQEGSSTVVVIRGTNRFVKQ